MEAEKLGTKWRISDIIEAIERERKAKGLPHDDMGRRLRYWAGHQDQGPLYMLRAWHVTIPSVLGLPPLPPPKSVAPAGAEEVTPEVEAVLQKLISEAKRLNVPEKQVREIEAAIVAEEHEMSTEPKPQPNPKPTIGRIVHYHYRSLTRDELITSAAIITGVDHERGTVNLTVFLDEGTKKGRGRTRRADNVSNFKTPMAYHWSWPPRDGS